EHYRFLLQKILSNPDIALVVKPKVPRTLMSRLGSVAPLLEEAKACGRCVVLSEGDIVGSYPPALAAMVSDITIHGHFAAATAGVEAILAGARTVMFDGEWWAKSSLYESSINKRVFRDWDQLWTACEHFWQNPEQYK